ncbi:fibulin-2 isoform X5 [Cebus imitator]|uniref:fibulin-2 isoform X5 n=1 Tax=Cebus imitator TaxID=2715852 RepID=UPI00080A02C6|nr:fibulin-2 isoform X5 [Cebus imitator]
MALLWEPVGAWLALGLALALGPSVATAAPRQDCTGMECPPLENCIEEALEPGACCATCVQQGCACEGYQYYDCLQGGFTRGRVPAGQSYFVDFGSTECSCPPGGGKISCQFMLCPELPPNCIEAMVVADSCPQCGQVGCVHAGRKYAAGHTVHLPPCRACHCPDAGGELICYQLPGCHGNFSNAEEGDSERHYEEPYSYDQEVAEAEAAAALGGEDQAGAVQAGAGPPPAALGGGNQPLSTIQAPPWPAALPRPTAAAALGPPAPVQAKTRRVTEDNEDEEEEEEEREETAVTEPLAAGGHRGLDRWRTTAPVGPSLPIQEERAEAKARPEENLIPDAQATPHSAGPEDVTPAPGPGTAAVVLTQAMPDPPRDPVKPSPHTILPTQPHDSAWVPPAPEVPRKPQVLPHFHAEEDTDPNSVHSVPRGSPEGSTKDLIETCCAAGQQWAIDNDECLEISESGTEGSVCRTAQRHCCVSYLKEKSCMAGVLGAKEGETCGAEDNDTCSVSLYKQCCDCCGLGLRVRAEGQSCESNPNLGYPCNHVMLSCCEGEEPLIVPEVRRPPEPAAAPRRVSEAEMAGREALSLGTEAELPNSLPGDDQDECLLLPGELCQHLCINTVGSYHCACFPGFLLQDDGRTCRPEGHRPQPAAPREPVLKSEFSQVAPNTIPLPLPQPNTCKDNGPCKQVCNSVGGSAMCSCFPGYAIMADGVSCEDINECTSLPEACRSGFSCINTVGSYTCQRNPLVCRRGYHASEDGAKCVDVNECETGVHRCGEDQVCHNLPGSYRCDCKAGFQRDAFGRACIDVNECWTSPGRLCQHTCENTRGSYRCSCASGFLLAADGKHCEDVNECEAHRCSQECANIYGSYQCYCRQGYQLAEDGHTCTDIDECAQGASILCTFRCLNVPGSYQCACPERGYTMTANGRSCKDLDECALGTHNCSEAETCHNIPGSFRCLRFDCPPNYVRVSNTKCERTTCHDFVECRNSPATITHYQLDFQTNLLVPTHIFRIGPAPAFTGDTIALTIIKGNEEGYFGTRRLTPYTGVVYLQRAVLEPRDFALDVEMKLWRQGSVTTFLAKMHIFFTTFGV